MSGTVFFPLSGQGSLGMRNRIQAIDVDLTSKSEYPICLKLLLNNQVHQRLPEVAVGQPFHWDQISPIDAKPTDYIGLRVYEVHFWRKVRIATVTFEAHQADHSSFELILNDNTGLVPCSIKFTFPHPETILSAPHVAQRSAAAAISQESSVLFSMGKACDMANTILKITGQVSELNPVTNVTFELCQKAWETLKQQGECDRLVEELVVGMGNMLPFVDAVRDQAKSTKLRTTIVEILHLIEDASRFVIEYKSDGVAVRAVRAFVSPTAQEQVDEIVKRFKNLKEDFDRGVMTQAVLEVEEVARRIETLLNDADREMLTRLITPDAGYDPSSGCLEGTRTTIRNDIQTWIDSGDSSHSLFWLYGLAGCGKSTVSRSICKELDETGRLGSAFFCKRDIEYLRKPENVVSTLAAHLAFAYQPYGARLVATLRGKPQLTSSALTIRFRGMIKEPFEEIIGRAGQQTMVIVIDALDECGTPNSRTQLLACLLEISELVPWLKVIITSRPNEDISGFFQKKREMVLRRDLFQEDPTSVYSDICLYIQDRLTQLVNDDEALGQRGLLNDEIVKQLASRSNGLFIWARTTCNVICNSVNPGEKIKHRLAGKTSQDTNEQLGSLYTIVLKETLGGQIDDAHKIRCCIAVVVLTRIPLVDTALAELLAGRVDLNELRLVVRRLASVLYRDQHGAVRVLHQSFSDYMMDERCPAEYRVGKDGENIALAISCLQIMLRELRFNICELQDSRQYNHEIPDLATQIQSKIRPHLDYSCVYWASHLTVTPVLSQSSQEHQMVVRLLSRLLLGPEALYWIESLSLLERLYAGETSLLDLIDWMQEPNRDISVHADELQRFIAAAYLPISQSTPHLYVSALAFGYEQFDTIRALKDRFPNVVEVTRGKHLGKLSNRWLKVIPHSSSIQSAVYSADGKLLATASKRKVQVWEVRTGATKLNPLEGHRSDVICIAFSSDSQYIVSGSADKTVRVWDLCTGSAALNPLEGHSEAVTSVVFSPNIQYVISGSGDGTVRVWDIRTGTAAINHLLEGHSDLVSSVAVSPDGQHIISGSWDKTVRVWDLHTGAASLSPLQGHSHFVISVACSPDGHYIASGSADMTVRIWDRHTGAATLGPLDGHSDFVVSVAFAPDGQHIISGSSDGTVRVWDLRTGTVVLGPLYGHSDRVTSVACSPDGQFIASGSEDQTVRIWSLHTPPALLNPEGHSGQVTSVAVSPNGQHIISGSSDKTVQVWDLHTGAAALHPLLGHSDIVMSVACSPDGRHILSGSRDKTVRLWDLHTGAAALHPLEGHSDAVTSVVSSPDGQHIISGSWDKTVRVWDLHTGAASLSPLQGHSDHVTSVACSPGGQYIVSGSADQTVRVWDLQTGAAALSPLQGYPGYVTSISCSLNDQLIVSGVARTVRLWDLRTGTAVLSPLQGHSGLVNSVSFSPDGQLIISGSADKTVQVWDLRTGGTALNPLRGHSAGVRSVACSSNGQHIVSGSEDTAIRLWDISSASAPLNEIPHDFPYSVLPALPVMSYQLGHSLPLTHDGWVLDKSQKPLLWLPTLFQRSFLLHQVDYSLYAISANPSDHPVAFSFSKFKCGSDWTSIRDANRI